MAAEAGPGGKPLWERKADALIKIMKVWRVSSRTRLRRVVWVAVCEGQLGVCRWLATRPGVSFCFDDNVVVTGAVANGHLDMCKWLSTQPGVRFDTFASEVMSGAAESGHLEMCKWLATQPGVVCVSQKNWVERCAAREGHLDVCEWLATQPGVSFIHVSSAHVRVRPWLWRQQRRERSVRQRVLFAMWSAWRIVPHRLPVAAAGNRKLHLWRCVPRGALAEVLMQISPVV